MAGLVQPLGDGVLGDFLRRFRGTLDTARDQGTLDEPDGFACTAREGSEGHVDCRVKRTGDGAQCRGCAALFTCGSATFSTLSCFTCASGQTDTHTSGNARGPEQGQRSDRQERADAFTEAATDGAFVPTLGLKRLLGDTGDLFDLLACRLLGVLGQQGADTSSCGFGQTNRTGHHAFEEFLDVAANRGFRFDSGALACFGQTTLDFGTALFALVPFGSEDQALLRSTFWPLNLVSRAIRCGDLIQRHG